MNYQAVLIGEEALRLDIRRAILTFDAEMTKLLAAGAEKTGRVGEQLAPKRTGAMAADWYVQTQPNAVDLVWAKEYAPILEDFSEGRYSILSTRYGPPPRFAGKAQEMEEDEVARAVERGLHPQVSAYGWFG